jgi:uncharacterized protein (DUF2141 family)
VAACLALAGAAAHGQPPAGARHVLHVVITGVNSSRGHVRVDVCRAEEFLKDCAFSGAATAVRGVTVVDVANLPPGTYAVQAYQDKNDNHTVDRDLLGLPIEGVGFSNDAPIRLRPPTFKAAAFAYDGGEQTITFPLHHFAG